jgi:hypothetical protein
MAIDGVVGGMQDADALLLAGSLGGIRRGLARPYVEDDPGAGFMNTVTKYMVSLRDPRAVPPGPEGVSTS